jgi:hypothetical protein
MRPLTRSILTACALAVATSASAFAQTAPDPGEADEELIARGVTLRKQGDDASALAVFEQAYSLRRSPRAAAQMALANQALGQWVRAEPGLVEALGATGDAWVDRNRPYLEESLVAVRAHLGWLAVESNAAGAEVWIGSKLAGRLPLDAPLRVAAGDLVAMVRAPGYTEVQRTLHVDAGERALAAFTFVGPSEAAASPIPPEPASVGTPAPVIGDEKRLPPSRHKAAWLTLVGAGALGLVGVGALVTREWEARIYDDDARCGPAGGLSRYARCGTNRDIGSAAQTVAAIALTGSAVAGVTGGVLLLGGSRRDPSPAAVSLGCSLAAQGIVCDGAF